MVFNAALERLYTGAGWAEGPVWFGDGRFLLLSDIPNNRMLRWLEDTGEVSVFRSPSNYSNGNFHDRQGRLMTCEHDSRRLTRTEHDGAVRVLMDSFQGKMPANVYRFDPETSQATVVANDMMNPKGICFSPDEKKLYIVDTGPSDQPGVPHPIRVYDVEDGKRLKNGLLFVDMSPGSSDGIRCDVDGNVWSAAGCGPDCFNGMQVFAPDGTRIGEVHLPETCANLCFGGAKKNRLFMAASQSLYALYVNTEGAQRP